MKSVLLPEGSSLTSRETITALKGSEFSVDILSSSRFSLTTFSLWKHKTIPVVNVNKEPFSYLNTVAELLQSGRYCTILPTHEEAWLFAESTPYLPTNIPLPVATSAAFQKVQGKIAFAQLAEEVGIPHPQWQLLDDTKKTETPCPYWMKADYGTAGRSVYKVRNASDKEQGKTLLSSDKNKLMIQENIEGTYGQVQAVFNQGTMIAAHTSLQQGIGAGGSAAARISVDYPETREHIDKIGHHITWHGGLTLDFIYHNGIPYYIECNPRMIEPANAAYAGANFPEILINLTLGIVPDTMIVGKAGVKTHSTMALLLGTAEKTKSRRAILKTFWQGITARGPLKNSTEVLTPCIKDPSSVIPLLAILLQLLISPKRVKKITESTVENYCVLPETIKTIQEK